MNQSLTYKKLRDYILIVFVYLFFRMNSYFTRGSTIEQFLLIGRVAIIALSFLLIFRVRFIPNKSMIILTGGSSFWFFLTGLQNYSGAIDILTNFLTQMWWASFLIISYLLLIRVRDDERKKIINIGVIAFYVFSLRYAIWLLSGNRYWSSGGINSIYYCVLLLPLCYLADKKTVKYSMIFIAALLTIISGKRTALISIILMRRSRAKIRWRQPLLTLAALTLLLAFDGSGILRVGLGCAVLHECGHALAYRLLWRRWPEIEVSPFGLCLRLRGLPMTNLQELLLAAAGPAVNLLACAAVLAFMRATAYTYGGYWFACCNLLVGTSNLLPLPGLDGAHIAACLLHFGRK